jgi:hypothetical protein
MMVIQKIKVLTMKKITILLLIVCNSIFAQKYFSKTGLTELKASVETFEPIEAKNNSTSVVLNSETGEIAALLFMKAFHFEVALMEEHFNENYIESNKFPKATFKGKIENFNVNELDPNIKLKIKGVLSIRGKEKNIETTGSFEFFEGKIVIISKFILLPQDFNIKIPSVVRNKIAKEINLFLNYELVEKK